MNTGRKIWILTALMLALALVMSGCSSTSEPEETEFVELPVLYSTGIDDDGYWKGVKAADYVDNFVYDGVSIPASVHEISDEEVESLMTTFLSGYLSRTQIMDRPVAEGDTVNIDFDGKMGTQVMDMGSTMEVGVDVKVDLTPDMDGSMEFLDVFVGQLVGTMPGETLEIPVTFPEDYYEEELRGQDCVFETTINYIVEQKELTDELVRENLSETKGWNTIAEMKEGIRASVRQSRIQEYIQEYITKQTLKAIPDAVYQYQVELVKNSFNDLADYLGMTPDEYVISYLSAENVDDAIEDQREDLEIETTFAVLVQYVAEQQGMTVTDADVEAYFAEHMWGTDSQMQIENYGMPYVKQSVLTQMVLDYMAEHAVLA